MTNPTTQRVLNSMLSTKVVGVLICAVWLFIASVAQAQVSATSAVDRTTNPFEKHVRVTEDVYVYDRSQFAEYTGAVLSPWNPNASDGIVERKRLGTVLVAAGVRMHLDLVSDLMNTNYELRDLMSGELVHVFSYSGTPTAPLLFSGQGVVYAYARILPMCWGAATRKYEYVNKKFIETRQPLLLVNAETELLRDIRLTVAPGAGASVVATLREGSKATVLAFEHPDRFLLRTPLGLTGWLFGGTSRGSLLITQCN